MSDKMPALVLPIEKYLQLMSDSDGRRHFQNSRELLGVWQEIETDQDDGTEIDVYGGFNLI